MFNILEFTLIGKFTKTHGNYGEIVVMTEFPLNNFIEDIDYIFANIENGLVPFKVLKFSIRNNEMIQFNLQNLESEESAKKLLGKEIFIKSDLIEFEDEELSLEYVIDQYTVYDKVMGLIGQVNKLISIDKNPLIQIINGKKEILIPFTEDFIEEIDHTNKEIHMNLPDGLLDINL